MPKVVKVQLATLTDKPPAGNEWLHEIKFDGYRMICRIDGTKVRFITRNQNDWTDRLSALVTAARKLPCKQAIIDGEIVVLKPDGTTDFQSLQNAFHEDRTDLLKYYVFDLLYLDGQMLSNLPLEERKAALESLVERTGKQDVIQFSAHVSGHGDEFKEQACRLHLEGMLCKRRDQPHRTAGRGLRIG